MESVVLETRAGEAKLEDLGRRATFANFEAFCMIMNFIPTQCHVTVMRENERQKSESGCK